MNPLLAMLSFTASYWVWGLFVLLLAMAAAWLYYRRTMPPLRWPVKSPLLALRIIAALALFLALAEALWSAIRVEQDRQEIVVLFDRSASMAQRDDADADRLSRAARYLKEHLTGPLADRAEIVSLYFDDQLRDPADPLPDSLGTATAIGDALEQLRRRPAGETAPRAAVLLSDGASNRGIDPASVAARLGYPIVSVGFGAPGAAQAQVAALTAPEVVFTGKAFEVAVDLQGGSVPGNVTVRMSSRGRTLEQKQATLAGPGQRLPLTLTGQYDTPGMHDLRVELLGPDGQVIPAAGKTAFINAMKGKLRVFLVGFRLDWEYGALRRWLSRQERVELIEYIAGPSGKGSIPTGSEWQSIDIAILLHPTRDQLARDWAPHVEAMSQSTKGTIILLNDQFSRGTYALPPPLEFVQGGLAFPMGEFSSDPMATRQNHPLVRLDPANTWEDTRRQWTTRPPWSSLVLFDTLPADADVLVRAAVSPGRDAPVVFTRPLKRGRALIVAGAPLWRWAMENAASGLAPEEYEHFWGNALRWLTLTDDADRLAVRTDLDVYHAGEPINLDGLVYDEAYRFIDRAEVSARIWSEEGRDTVRLVLNPGAGDRFQGQVSALPPGTYRYDGVAKVEDQTLPLSGGMFRIEPYGLEQRFASLDEGTLRAIARESGGRYYSEDERPAVLDSLDLTPVERERKLELALGNHWLILTIFIAALSIEWFVRRRKQLL
ncbi:MAG TPA: hypothetical protein VNN55_06455 [bacterium]|nr:hypothetical protein [bacterium]